MENAIRGITIWPAIANFEENEKGSIEPGKLADFVVLEKDPTKTDPSAIKDIPINKTVVGGKITYEA